MRQINQKVGDMPQNCHNPYVLQSIHEASTLRELALVASVAVKVSPDPDIEVDMILPTSCLEVSVVADSSDDKGRSS